jgi:hypothetical protein
MNLDDEYKRKMTDVDKKLREPKISKEIDAFLLKLSKEFKCDFRLMYDYYPESVDYDERMSEGLVFVPPVREAPTMKLGEFIKHIDTEDRDFKVFIDPLYMHEGLNEINNVLTTVIENDNVIIVPISHNKKKKEQ